MAKNDNQNIYKDTLNLPQTTFDMRANLLEKEPRLQAWWQEQNLYDKICAARKDAEQFILHDGPPYANGNIHMGTALNKILKDIVIRSKNMAGFKVPYIPGWDCHGLPIEAKVMEELGAKARELSPLEIRHKCRAYAEKFVKLHSGQFQRLGVMGEFDNPYITMSPQYEADALEVFARLIEQGIVYKQLKPVHWSIDNRTALADAELEYYDREDASIFVAFRLVDVKATLAGVAPSTPMYVVIWTTTPWTLVANRAVAVHPDFEYAAVQVDSPLGRVVVFVAAERLEALKAAGEKWMTGAEVLATCKGSDLVKAQLRYAHPLSAGVTCPVVAANYVTLEDGTGLVHTAPGHGTDDYYTGLNNNLEIYCPVQADGTYDMTAPAWLQGKSVWDGNGLVVEYLEKQKTLVAIHMMRHSYPHDWRSKTPTIFRATEQWFIGVDKPLKNGGHTLRQMALDVCGKALAQGGVDFIPSWGRNRILGMLESRPDWCLSRQRSWGLPITAFYNPQGRVLCTPFSVREVAKTIRALGSDAWFNETPKTLLGDYRPQDDTDLVNADEFDVETLEKGYDIFDVWFESGSSWYAVAVARGVVEEPPVDLYLEGSDQHRGWFQLSLLPCLGVAGTAPFKKVLTHGFVVTDSGHKMSKSLGNTIEPQEQLTRRGADILRLWVASQNYQDDIRCSEKLIEQAEDAYRKIRNTIRFCMGSIGDYDPAKDYVAPMEHSVGRWMQIELQLLIKNVRDAYDKFEFHRATRLLYEFCTIQASSVYLTAVKDRLYCDLPDSPRRRACQGIIRSVLIALVKLAAPILPHTCEEAWRQIPHRDAGEPDSVHLSFLPKADEKFIRLLEDVTPIVDDDLIVQGENLQIGPAWIWERLMDIRGEALVMLEDLRNRGVKNQLDAEVIFTVSPQRPGVKKFMQLYVGELEDMLGVGYACVVDGSAPEGRLVGIQVLDAREKYNRCERSWKRRPDVGSDSEYPTLSARDAAVMRQMKNRKKS